MDQTEASPVGAPSDPAGLLRAVQDVAERLARSKTVDEVAATVATVVRDAVGAEACTVSTLTPDQRSLVNLALTNVSPRTAAVLQHPVRVAPDMPAGVAVRSGEPVVFSSLDERDRNFPQLAGWPSEHQAWAVYPLMSRGHMTGIVSFGWKQSREFRPHELAFGQAVAHQCAVALDRAQLLESERRDRRTLELLSDATRVMISALNPLEVVERLAGVAVPALAHWCVVYTPDGDVLRAVALAGRGVVDAKELLDTADPIPIGGDSGTARCFRTGGTIVSSDIPESATAHVSGAAATALRATPIRSGVAVPIVAADETIGVLVLAFSDVRPYTPELRFAAEGLAARAGIALRNATRFQHERHTVETLTEALLPRTVPRIPGYEFSARYLPAGDPVAGDWYDVMPVGDGFLIGVGDVGGHGIDAAAAMAEFRNAARGVAISGGQPDEIIGALAGLAWLPDLPDMFATAVYGTLDPAAGTFVWAGAGHLPPLRFDPAGATFDVRAQRPALGAPIVPPRPSNVAVIPEGAGLVLITDGVVERRRGPDIRESLDELAHFVASHQDLDADGLADGIVSEFCEGRDDDCCIVVIRRLG